MCDHDCVGGAGRARGLLIASALVGVVITVAACGPPPSHAPDGTLAMEPFFRELIILDGALGTSYLMATGPLTLDLRGAMPARLPE